MRCDCLDRCGDDPRVHTGAVASCAHRKLWLSRARIRGVSRDAAAPNTLIVIYDRPPDDDDLRALHDFDRWPCP